MEALAAWRKAESKRDSDITVARMNYSRAASELSDSHALPSVHVQCLIFSTEGEARTKWVLPN